MADINNRDITEAKRRVLEMQNRASRFVDGAAPAEQGSEAEQSSNKNKQSDKIQDAQDKHTTKADIPDKNADDEQNDDQKSFFIILALIMLLSKEEADNTLILALLYLLL